MTSPSRALPSKTSPSSVFVFLALVFFALPALGSHTPGATLLVPYFEVDLESPGGSSSLVSINNADQDPALAHVVMWTNLGVPTLAFDLYLAGDDIVTFNLRDVFAGTLPLTSAPSPDFPGCADDPLPDLGEVDLALLRAHHRGQPSPEGGLCSGVAVGAEALATGYLTIDVVNGCSETTNVPGDPGYFQDGGSGLASNRNVLWGDVLMVDPDRELAQGFNAVPLVADAALYGPGLGSTFYRFYSDFDGGDNRRPLGVAYRGRFLNGGAFTGGTDLILWSEGTGLGEPQDCDVDTSSSFQFKNFRFYDESAKLVHTARTQTYVRSERLAVGQEPLPVPTLFGFVEVDTEHWVFIFSPPSSPEPRQGLLITTLSASGGFSAAIEGTEVAQLPQP